MVFPLLKSIKYTLHYINKIDKNLYLRVLNLSKCIHNYVNVIPIKLNNRPHIWYPNWSICGFNFFSCSTINTLSDKNMELILNEVIHQYSNDKEKLVKLNSFTGQSLWQIENLLKQVIELDKERIELEDFQRDDADFELKKLASEDVDKINYKIFSLKKQLFTHLLEFQISSDIKEVYLEVSAGVGGQEAMLFAQELLEMYQGFCLLNGWNVELNSCEATPLGGIRHGCLVIEGLHCYTKLKYEGGIHRVQRVPKTEKTGRVHTSTVSVAVLPHPSEIMININSKDLKIETMRAGGPGGQNVNKTDSAVRISHLPSGMVAECQTNRVQDQNKREAMRKLRTRLYQKELDEQEAKFSSEKRLQIGTKARSEKIRTYNFPQDRITDHRLGLTMHNVVEMLNGGLLLEKLVSELVEVGRIETLLELFPVQKQ